MGDSTKSIRNILLIMVIILVFIILKELSGLLMPVILAALLTVLNLPLVNFLKKRRVPDFLITLLVAVLSLVIIWLIISLISGTVQQIIDDKEFLAAQFSKRINSAILWLGATIPGINVDFFISQMDNI
ncbi:MAG: AI-2E family transporter, partial [Spirochaetaceae bacterium]|nr:AI-2E family transporter [Spirochaetaceae bacterium]